MAMNQCDGCRRGMPIRDGNHYNPDGSYDHIGCTRHLYECPRCGADWNGVHCHVCDNGVGEQAETETCSDCEKP